MRYFLKKTTPSKKGTYLQIYISEYISKVGNRNHQYQNIGYVEDLKKAGIEDPIKYAEDLVQKLNEPLKKNEIPQIGDVSLTKNLGYFLLKIMIDKLDVDKIIDIFTQTKRFDFKVSSFIRSLIYAQVANPGSKLKAHERVIPNIYGIEQFSYDQILDGIEYIGSDYQKYIEAFNLCIQETFGRETKVNFFDCTNYYFEIDQEDDLRRKGPSKENRKDPIIGQALLLDSEQIPIGMMMYPGNQSEKGYLRKMAEDTKERYGIEGRTIYVADKGLNCAKNIYFSSKTAQNGYIFSKSIHGKNLNEQEKKWILFDNEMNVRHDVLDKDKSIKYRYKETVDTFDYSFFDDNGEKISFQIKEKRVVTFNPALASKTRAELNKLFEKAKSISTHKELYREEFGDVAKYINFETTTLDGKKVKVATKLNDEKFKEDLRYAGYNLLVTSEIDMKAQEIYNVYHGLWKIENSFRILKSYLNARPVFLQDKYKIYGHFTICYLALTVLRLLETKIFKNELSSEELVEFIRSYIITDNCSGKFLNSSTKSSTFEIIKEALGLSKLGNLTLTKKDVKNLLEYEF